jgi:hypothetical protein
MKTLSDKGVRPNEEWLDQCLNFLSETYGPTKVYNIPASSTMNKSLVDEVLKRFMTFDMFETTGQGIITPDLHVRPAPSFYKHHLMTLFPSPLRS